MAFFPYTVTESNITILFNGTMNKIPRTHAGFTALSEHLKSNKHDADVIESLLDKREAMARLTSGKVKVVGSTVFYKGEAIHSTLAMKLVTMVDEGFDATPWARFLDNVMLNPSEVSRGCLFDFLEHFETPLTDDGCFVAFKGIRDDYTDCHTGTFDNSPGQTVEMPRDDVVEEPSQTCQAGLHVCASHYLDSFWGNSKIIAVKVNPADVVSVPNDYNYSKMRVCKYIVLGDIEDERHRTRVEQAPVITANADENRIASAEPTAFANGYIVPDGYEFDPADPEPAMGDRVIKAGSPDIGIMCWVEELDEDDCEHPQNAEWVSGDITRDEIDCYIGYAVQFEHGTDIIAVKDGEDCGLRIIVEVEDDEDILTEDEELTFYHEATGLTFTASAIKSEVAEIGQRGFHREHGVPRTTVQEWLKAINA